MLRVRDRHADWQDPADPSHIHVSLQDSNGKNIFALSDDEIKAGGRKDAAYEGIKYLSQEAEWFLAGLVDGLPDGEPMSKPRVISHPSCPHDVPHNQFVQTIVRR